MTPDEIITTAERFVQETGVEAYRVFAGLKKNAEFSKIFQNYKDIFTHETIEAIKKSELPEKEKSELRLRVLRTGAGFELHRTGILHSL